MIKKGPVDHADQILYSGQWHNGMNSECTVVRRRQRLTCFTQWHESDRVQVLPFAKCELNLKLKREQTEDREVEAALLSSLRLLSAVRSSQNAPKFPKICFCKAVSCSKAWCCIRGVDRIKIVGPLSRAYHFFIAHCHLLIQLDQSNSLNIILFVN